MFFSFTCAYSLKAQVWTNFISAAPNIGAPDIYCAVEDTNSHTLYFGGDGFVALGQFTTNSIVKFDGTNFDTLQSGIDDLFPGNFSSQVKNLVFFKNKIFVFGHFEKAGKTYTKNMAVWDCLSSSWGTLTATGNNTPDFAYFLNGDMYVWGLDSINGIKITGLGRFDGINWYDVPVPTTPGHTASHIVEFQGKLYKSGQVTPSSSDANLSYSDGTNWIPWVGISGDNNKAVFGMKVIDTMMFVYGRFYSISGTQCAGLAGFNGKNWFGFGQGLSTDQGWETVENIQKIGNDLYITGLFNKIEGIGNSNFPALQTTNLAKFDGEKWCILSPPINNTALGVVEYKNQIYMYGAFEKIGGDTVRSFGRYNGGVTDICSHKVSINPGTLGLEDMDLGIIKIYPNPTQTTITLESNGLTNPVLLLQLLNPQGVVVYSNQNGDKSREIDLSGFSSGIYYLKVSVGSERRFLKVVKE